MLFETIYKDIEETTMSLTEIIYQKYREHTHGTIKGYLVPDHVHNIICKKERKDYSLDSQSFCNAYHWSIKCSETDRLIRSLSAMIIAYSAKNNITDYFSRYPFKKFEIELETYPKYRYEKNRFVKYRKTGDDITFLKVDIEW